MFVHSLARTLDFKSQRVLIWQRRAIFGSHHLIGQAFKRVFRHGFILFRAQNQADGRVFVVLDPVLSCIVEI